MQGASPLAFPRLNPRGTCSPCRCGALWGACPLCRLPPLPLVCFSAPYPPDPLPRWGRGGGYKFISPGASPPAPPGLNPWFAAKTEERCSLRAVPAAKERGDRGRGTIRRTRRRRLRWSSPPGLGEQVPQGEQSPAPHRAPPLFLPPPPANKKFRKSSWGFGGFFQEAPNTSLPPAPLITAAASGASTMPGMPNRRKPAYMESRDRRGWMPSERPTRCGSATSRRTEEIA